MVVEGKIAIPLPSLDDIRCLVTEDTWAWVMPQPPGQDGAAGPVKACLIPTRAPHRSLSLFHGSRNRGSQNFGTSLGLPLGLEIRPVPQGWRSQVPVAVPRRFLSSCNEIHEKCRNEVLCDFRGRPKQSETETDSASLWQRK